MRCAYCGVGIAWHPTSIELDPDREVNQGHSELHYDDDHEPFRWRVEQQRCSECNGLVVHLVRREYEVKHFVGDDPALPIDYHAEVGEYRVAVWPRNNGRNPCPPEVPAEISKEYQEAAMVLAASPAASAALSRRCMQHILRDGAGIRKGDLSKEIDAAISSRRLSDLLSEQLDAVRNIGNFAAHPTKSTATGQVIEVEPGEAEWNLDVIEGLMDAYYVSPARAAQRKAALNKKLIEAGKPPLP